jgi:hypothetical protein
MQQKIARNDDIKKKKKKKLKGDEMIFTCWWWNTYCRNQKILPLMKRCLCTLTRPAVGVQRADRQNLYIMIHCPWKEIQFVRMNQKKSLCHCVNSRLPRTPPFSCLQLQYNRCAPRKLLILYCEDDIEYAGGRGGGTVGYILSQ